MLSQIGKPIDKPLMASIKIIPPNNTDEIPAHIKSEATAIADEELANITKITNLILEGKETLY